MVAPGDRERIMGTIGRIALAFAALLTMQAGAMAADKRPVILRIGMVAPAGAAAGIPGLSTIRRAYNQATGLQVRVFAARDMAALVEAQVRGRVHYAVYSAAGYAAAQAACACVEPIAAPVGANGDTGVSAVIYARSGSATRLADASTLAIVAGPDGGLGPQVLAMEALAEHGAGDDVMLAATMSEAEQQFAAGGADIIVGWEPAAGAFVETVGGTADRLLALGMEQSDLIELWRSEPLRHGPHAMRSDLPEDIKTSLRTFLLNVRSQQPVVFDLIASRQLGGFVAVTDSDYAAAATMVSLAAE
jgi:phosphonate transport system substrate-binding protein